MGMGEARAGAVCAELNSVSSNLHFRDEEHGLIWKRGLKREPNQACWHVCNAGTLRGRGRSITNSSLVMI